LYASRPEDTAGMAKPVKMQALLNGFVAEMAAKTRQYPEQWFNYYDFWKA